MRDGWKTGLVVLSAVLIGLTAALGPKLLHNANPPVYSPSLQDLRAQSVMIEVDGIGHGSGFIYSPTEVMTVAHVVRNAKKIILTFLNGETIEASVEWTSKKADVALLKFILVHPMNFYYAPAKIACNHKLVAGEDITVIGSPLQVQFGVSRGEVMSDKPLWLPKGPPTTGPQIDTLVPYTAVTAPGSSGGPVFNKDGYVIGLVDAILNEVFGSDIASMQASTINLYVPEKFFCGSELRA